MNRTYPTRFRSSQGSSRRSSESSNESDEPENCAFNSGDGLITNNCIGVPQNDASEIFWFRFIKASTSVLILFICVLFGGLYHLNKELIYIKQDYNFLKGELETIKNVHFMIEAKQEKILEDINKLTKKDQNVECKIDDKSVQQAIDNYDADKTGLPDYALESAGASIVTTRDTKDFPRGNTLSLFGMVLCSSNKGARAILQPNVSPGECWAFKGTTGAVVVQLLKKIYVTGVTLEHISKNISPSEEITSAPKEFSVFGLRTLKDFKPHFLGKFVYKLDNRPVQYFCIDNNHMEAFLYVEIKFLSNYGQPDYTCVYRVRIHGTPE